MPSLFQATDLTEFECPFRVDWHCPVEVSQILTVLSRLALARDLPSGLHVTALTSLKAFKSVSMHKNNCFEKARKFLRNLPRVPVNGASGVGLGRLAFKSAKIMRPIELALTIRVVFAAKLLKMLILHALSLLILPSVKSFCH